MSHGILSVPHNIVMDMNNVMSVHGNTTLNVVFSVVNSCVSWSILNLYLAMFFVPCIKFWTLYIHNETINIDFMVTVVGLSVKWPLVECNGHGPLLNTKCIFNTILCSSYKV